MNHFKVLLTGFTCLMVLSSSAQERGDEITLTGIVLKMDSLVPLPNANIFIKTTHMGVHSNEFGLFSIKVHSRDTVVFSAVGSQTTFYIVPDTLKVSHYSIIQRMPINNVILKTVEITSWPSLEQFNQTFTRDHGFDEELPNAQQNANPDLSGNDMNKVEMDAYANYQIEGMRYQNRFSYVYENAHIPVNNLLNPKRWDKLVEDIKSGNY